MAFYLVVKGRLTPYQFPYLDIETPVRLEETQIRGRSALKGKNKAELENALQEVFAIDVMTSSPLTLSPAARIFEVEQLMNLHKIGHVPLVIDKKVCGLISRHDLPGIEKDARTDKVMTKLVLVASEGTPLRQIAEVFLMENINSLPVVDNDLLLTGIITHRDLLRWSLDEQKFQR